MNPKRNYQKELEKRVKELEGQGRKRLLLHSCCGPCSSYCVEYLSEWFDLTVFYYNPNITQEAEYRHRVSEQQRLLRELGADLGITIDFAEGSYEPSRFLEISKGLESCPERGERCEKCFALRLEETARYAKENGYDLFTTTLSISPMKDADVLNGLGEAIAAGIGVEFLNSDFKKRNGYKRSIELSKKYGLYRQDYCGCGFSKAQREREKQEQVRDCG